MTPRQDGTAILGGVLAVTGPKVITVPATTQRHPHVDKTCASLLRQGRGTFLLSRLGDRTGEVASRRLKRDVLPGKVLRPSGPWFPSLVKWGPRRFRGDHGSSGDHGGSDLAAWL